MQVRGNALMHYIDVGVHVYQSSDLPPGAVTNPADGACQVYCTTDDTGAPAEWGCIQGSCTTTCTVKTVTVGGQTVYYCGCS